MRVVAISDTHGHNLLTKWEIPEGDVLIHAGDATARGSEGEIVDFHRKLQLLPHKVKIFVPGNHDRLFNTDPEKAVALMPSVYVLMDQGIKLNGVKFWGSPALPYRESFRGYPAFNQTIADIKETWAGIPGDTNILITHSPAYQIRDKAERLMDPEKFEHLGCPHLRERIMDLSITAGLFGLRYHIFGHVHEEYGIEARYNDIDNTELGKEMIEKYGSGGRIPIYWAMNAALTTNMNRVADNKPHVIEVPKGFHHLD